MNKKFALLLVLLAAMVMGSVASASAAEVKATGSWTISAEWTDRNNFSEVESNTFAINQRARTAFHFVANENLKAVLNTQIGTAHWGSGLFSVGAGRSAATTGGAASAGAGNIMLREGYVKFTVPSTKAAVIAGFQGLSLPSAVGGGSAIFDDQVGAVAAVVPVMDSLTLVGGYGRALEAAATTGSKTSFDVAFAYADVKLNGFNLQPFLAYGYSGAKSGADALAGFSTANGSISSGTRAYFGGIAATIDAFNPIKIMADFNYGKATKGAGVANAPSQTRSGWLFDMQIDYTGLSMMTPSLVFSYTSGEKDPNGNSSQANRNSNRMPVISAQNYAIGSFWMQGSNSLNADGLGGTSANNLGYWLLGLQLKDIKFIDKLTHTVNVLYFKGTNDDQFVVKQGRAAALTYGQFLTDKDSLWEVDVNTKYQVYSELAAHLELGYINPSFNKTTWNGNALNGQGNKDAYKVAAILNYSF